MNGNTSKANHPENKGFAPLFVILRDKKKWTACLMKSK